MLEQELRRAMAEDTAELRATPDLASRAVRGSRRRARTRFAAVSVALAMAAGFLVFFTSARPAPVVAAVVDQVEVVGLPPDPGTARPGRVTHGSLRGATMTWGSGGDLIRVTVYRGAGVVNPADLGRLRLLGEGAQGSPTSVRGRAGRLAHGGTDLLWMERPGLLLRVTVGERRTEYLRPVAEGLRPADPTGPAGGVFEGMRIGYLPDGVHLSGVSELGGADVHPRVKRWEGADGRAVALYSERRPGLDLARWADELKGLRLGPPTQVNGRNVHPALTGDARVWTAPTGQTFALSVTGNLADELDRILAGIVPVPPRAGAVFEGIDVGFVPQWLETGGQVTERHGARGVDWRDVDGRLLRVETITGADTLDELAETAWPPGERPVELRRTTEHHKPAYEGWVRLADGSPQRRVVMWLERPGFGVRVQVSDDLAGKLRDVLDGIFVPGPNDPTPESS
ncbi:hypothetical protein HII36_02850 [Nonomuraea sp. NN258]|uniref:hypothetical protein n=1 Tax=Nonomuraea antri TaxID=2730852 RepID=UPI001567DA90|nr:hypothetical protein [Nonomuraea antri]NRQ30778.1 hypothetical protein [Nonomuraea antri]